MKNIKFENVKDLTRFQNLQDFKDALKWEKENINIIKANFKIPKLRYMHMEEKLKEIKREERELIKYYQERVNF